MSNVASRNSSCAILPIAQTECVGWMFLAVPARVRKYSDIAPTFVGVVAGLNISGGRSVQLSAGITNVPASPTACSRP